MGGCCSIRRLFTASSLFHPPELMKEFVQDAYEKEIPLQAVLEKSKQLQFPTNTSRLEFLLKDASENSYKDQMRARGMKFDEDVAAKYVNSAYPIIHEQMLPLLAAFLDYKKKSNQALESVYYKDKNIYDLVNKLLQNRPIAFLTSSDSYLLSNGVESSGGFENIGIDNLQVPELSIEEYNSYDEMRLAALVGVSSLSPFINKGDRYNEGRPGDGVDHELEGVIVGQVGARFEKKGLMDWQDCIVYHKQNSAKNGYGRHGKGLAAEMLRAWAKTWEVEYLHTFSSVKASSEGYVQFRKDHYLNEAVYKARIQILAEILLLEAISRAKEVRKKAYIHVVGLGLGVWQIDDSQQSLFISAWADAIENIPNHLLQHISHIDFSWIRETSIRGVTSGSKFPKTDVTMVFSKRNLHDRVPEGCLLVCNYAWDSNSAPGNEYWLGSLSASGDPAAACSSSIAELHNTRVNSLAVSSGRLRIATRAHGVLTVPEYISKWEEGGQR